MFATFRSGSSFRITDPYHYDRTADYSGEFQPVVTGEFDDWIDNQPLNVGSTVEWIHDNFLWDPDGRYALPFYGEF